jgi:transcriptional repressor NrdR
MNCPQCDASSHVVETRAADEGAAVRRRRECSACSFRFTTFERMLVSRVQVAKRDGRRQPFDPEKLRGALIRAAHKRPVSAAQIAGVVSGVEAAAASAGGLIDASRIGELCLERLGDIDRGAYLQFAGTLPEITPEIASFGQAGSVRTWVQSGQPR